MSRSTLSGAPTQRSAPAAGAPRSGAPGSASALGRIWPLLEIPRGRLLAAALTAAATLAAAFALAAVSGWLITTSWTRPPVLDLTVAVVSVRALGVSRGVFRWLDRMLTHDVALRGVVSLRTNLFTALAARRGDALSRLRRGDLLTRLGDDAQEMGDVVIRAVVPVLVAIVMGAAVVLTIAPLSLGAAAAMVLALLLAGLLAPLAAHRAAVLTEHAVIRTRSLVSADALEILDDATALRIQGALDSRLAQLESDQRAHDAAIDRAALPSAIAAAAVPLAMILAVLGSVLAAGAAWTAGGASAGVIGILLLLPLSSFEAATALPAAASQLARSRAAAARLADAIGEPAPNSPAPFTSADAPAPAAPHAQPSAAPTAVPALAVHGLSAGWDAHRPRVTDLDLDLAPGARLAVVGPSGAGKSTLLLTLAGLLDPLSGSVSLDGDRIEDLPEAEIRARVVLFAEDAHVFATTLAENLRVVRGDLSEEEMRAALSAAGLDSWVRALPQGLETRLGADGTTVSGGERRRLLLARAIARRAPITVLDEPTEHLGAAHGDDLLRRLLDPEDGSVLPVGASAVIVTHREEAILAGTPVLRILPSARPDWRMETA
ncbi:thiol reductant ABC exporter subunit CydC [Brachybacterium sp. JHP9]|uniref:Thiol reductant ABC exporter subunit CydC n=1 Tax=Brachybacterium equifaecis TaxID=2910770 RepID=A0ABT0R0W1_9MICO|nr:thiol reductant ABC exporter subunit CydC [Brachybacterium equifaecis]MCL6423555.1 thiol reductant ABC exporter subunit CydC [Brachybacterium equifaecis]